MGGETKTRNESDESTDSDRKPFIGTIEEAPIWIKLDNEFIKTGYRINYRSKWLCFKSLF